MTELLTAAQMRAIEQAAIASGEVTGLELMERAGQGVVEAIFAEWPELAEPAGAPPRTPEYFHQEEMRPSRAVVLCGPGNNGGDGFVVARLLKARGWAVAVFLYGDPERMPPDARVNYERWRGMGEVGAIVPGWSLELVQPSVVVDALFGTGLTRPLSGELLSCVRNLDRRSSWKSPAAGGTRMRTVAVDIRSGVCADSGKVLVDAAFEVNGDMDPLRSLVRMQHRSLLSDLTVTFQSPKVGHYLGLGPVGSGRLIIKRLDGLPFIDLGYPEEAKPNARPTLLEPRVHGREIPGLHFVKGQISKVHGHKYAHGHALVLSGSSGHGGAARLAARGALRIGAGVVTVGCPPESIAENAARLDAVMLRGIADADALAGMLEDKRISALCLGPGMGTGAREAALLATALGLQRPPPLSPPHKGEGGGTPRTVPPATHTATDRTTIITPPAGRSLPLPPVGRGEGWGADDTTQLATTIETSLTTGAPPRATVLDADALTLLAADAALFAALHGACVLTPHAGEFARLFPDIAERLASPATKGPAYSKVDATRDAAKRAGCVVLFKGPDTVIAAADGRCAINSAAYERAAPWLATAGSGDVLAGFITGLLARGLDPFDAACAGAWLHVECARSFGPGLIAEDLPEELPKVFRALEL